MAVSSEYTNHRKLSFSASTLATSILYLQYRTFDGKPKGSSCLGLECKLHSLPYFFQKYKKYISTQEMFTMIREARKMQYLSNKSSLQCYKSNTSQMTFN